MSNKYFSRKGLQEFKEKYSFELEANKNKYEIKKISDEKYTELAYRIYMYCLKDAKDEKGIEEISEEDILFMWQKFRTELMEEFKNTETEQLLEKMKSPPWLIVH